MKVLIDRSSFATVPFPAILIRKLDTMEMMRRIDLSSLEAKTLKETKEAIGNHVMFTPDGKFLLLFSSTGPGADETKTRHTIFFFGVAVSYRR